MKAKDPNLIEFLRESNAIEQVYDDESLRRAGYAWNHIVKESKLSIGSILKTHKILMIGQPLRPNERGYFRQVNVIVGSHRAPDWQHIPELMMQWLLNHGDAATEDAIKIAHIEFENVHPFRDGNGRLGRIIMNYQRVKAGLPILVVKESEKWDYYEWFNEHRA